MSKIPVGSRNVAPNDRPITVTMTAREWELLLGWHLGAVLGPIQDGSRIERGQALRKLEAQIGGAA